MLHGYTNYSNNHICGLPKSCFDLRNWNNTPYGFEPVRDFTSEGLFYHLQWFA
jgi:hypothetical protein